MMQSVPTPGSVKRFNACDKWKIGTGGDGIEQEEQQQPPPGPANTVKRKPLGPVEESPVKLVEPTEMLLPVDNNDKLTSPDQDVKAFMNSLKRERVEIVDEVGSDEDRPELGKYNFELLPVHNIQEREGNKAYRCDICGGTYRHAFSLKRHYLRTHINYIYLSSSDISNCNITLSYAEEMARDEYQTRVRSGTDTTMLGLYRCNTCSLLFNELPELKHHVLNHPNTPSSKRFPCNQCNMTFSHKQNLVRHSSVHSGEKPYACKYCRKGFPTATNQRRHERIHEGVKPYLCPHCASNFSQSGDLKKHIRKLHREFFHPCAFCLKYFSKESDLKDHVLSHGQSLEMNYKVLKRKINCTRDESVVGPRLVVSNGAWSSKGVHQQHVETKSIPQTKFICAICKSRFSSRNNLRKHQMLVHERSNNQKTGGYSVSQVSSEANCYQPRNGTSTNYFLSSSKHYTSVSQNIALNLQFFIDGKLNNNKSQKHNKTVGTAAIEEDSWPVHDPASKKSSRSNYRCDTVTINKEDFNTAIEDWEMTDEPLDCDYHSSASRCNDECLQCNGNAKTNVEEENIEVLDLSVSRVHPSSLECQSDKNKPITLYICHACGERFFSLVDIEDHKVNNHPNVICTHLEVEGMKNVPSELFPSHCSLVGVLQRCPVPPSVDIDATILLQCTKCQEAFQKSADLHEHILQCGGHSDSVTCERYPKRGRPMKHSRRMVLRGMKRQLDDEPIKVRKTFVQKNKKTKKDEYSWLQNCERPRMDRSQSLESEADLMCDGCNRKFKYSSGLERHQKTCLVSESASAREDALKDVRRQHSCKYCLRSFTYMASLKKHMTDVCSSKTAQSAKLTSVTSKSMQTILAKKKLRAKKKPRKLRFRFMTKKTVSTPPVTVDDKTERKSVQESSPVKLPGSPTICQDDAKAVSETCEKDSCWVNNDDETVATVVDKPASPIPDPAPPPTTTEHETSSDAVPEDDQEVPIVEMKSEKEEQQEEKEEQQEEAEDKKTAAEDATEVQKEEEKEEERDDEDASKSKEEEKLNTVMQETSEHVVEMKTAVADDVAVNKTTSPEVVEPKKEGSIKIESDCGSLNVRREQMHTCPNCKRTFTYLANFKKHLNDLCPLRTVETKDSCDSGVKSALESKEKTGGTSTSAQESEDQDGGGSSTAVTSTAAPRDRPSDIGKEMNGSYVTMLKHRLSHKLKTSPHSDSGGTTSSDSRKAEPLTTDTSGSSTMTTRASSSCVTTRSSERRRQMNWSRGRKRGGGGGSGTSGPSSRKTDAGTSSSAFKQRVSPRTSGTVSTIVADKAAVNHETEEQGNCGSSDDAADNDDGDDDVVITGHNQEQENEVVDNGHNGARDSKAALSKNRAKNTRNNSSDASTKTSLASSSSISDTGNTTIQKGFISQCRKMIQRKVKESNLPAKCETDDGLDNGKEDG